MITNKINGAWICLCRAPGNKMNPGIIHEGLVKYDFYNPTAFINNASIYRWKDMETPDDRKVWVMDCDLNGELLKEGLIMFFSTFKRNGKKYWQSFKVAEEILLEKEGWKFAKNRILDNENKLYHD